jgi:DNA polymerase III alpha subunit
VRSHFSFLDSTLSVPAIIALARQHGLASIAVCDRGNLHAAVEFTVAARAAGLHPVLGAEVQCRHQPLRLFVENQTGYANLCRILSAGADTARGALASAAETRRPEVPAPEDPGDPDAVERAPVSRRPLPEFNPAGHATEGLLAVSADPAIAPSFPGRFYRAIDTPNALRRYAPHPGDPPAVPVVTVQYAAPADRWKFDIVQSIRTLTLLRQPHPAKVIGGQRHFRSPRELESLFGRRPELLAHLDELAARCQFSFALGQLQFPDFHPPGGRTPRAFLRHLVERGLAARYPAHRTAALRPQLDAELAMIAAVGYEPYFLVVWELLGRCRAQGIEWITRGSAADSLVCYCLGISGVCPIRFDLYFRRFLNQERMALNKLPDIDIDFPHDRKDDVLDLLFDRYGPVHCAVVGGFSTFQARSAFAEVAKVLGVADRDVRRFTQHFPWSFGGHGLAVPTPTPQVRPPPAPDGRLVQLLRASPECRDLPLDEEPYRSALAMAEVLDGAPRYAKMHPCGVVLAHQPIHDLTPTFVSHKGYPTTHFDMDAVEAVGLVKLDILAQGGLAVMRDVQAAVAQRGLALDLDRLAILVLPAPTPAPAASETRTAAASVSAPNSALQAARPSCQPDLDSSADPESPRLLVPLRVDPADRPASAEPPLEKDLNDPAVWDLIAGGQARAVHHIESPAMTSLCRMTQVRDIDTLVALVSVIRPGAANEDKKREFTRRYQRLSPVHYPHPSLEHCLRGTFGLVVYEEHILQICEAFAGLPGGRADVLRRALVKDRWAVVAEIAPEFAACARNLGRTEDEIARVWALVIGFHGYAFCKAHSAAYGVEAYQSAWLKLHFPAEFMAAVLSNGKGFYRPFVYVLECHRLGIPLVPPCINDPGPGFHVVPAIAAPAPATPSSVSPMDRPPSPSSPALSLRRERVPAGRVREDGSGSPSAADRPESLPASAPRMPLAIRVPVAAIASITRATQDRLLAEHARCPFESLADFFVRVHPAIEEAETLARAGAFDTFGNSRCRQFWEIQQLHARFGSDRTRNQSWLLPPTGLIADPAVATPASPAATPTGLPGLDLTEPGRLQRLQWELELLGFPASGHPLELYPDIAWATYCPVNRLHLYSGREVTLCGLVIEDRVHHQTTGEPMKFLTLADWTGMIETELFAQTYKTYGLATVRYPVLEVTGRVEPFENGRGHTLRVLHAGKPRSASR